jgi:hypothetical protein
MIRIPLTPEMIQEAKDEQKKFDAQKTWNKFPSPNNYIGLLGEMALDIHLTSLGLDHEWVAFNKQGWKHPDFRYNGLTIDMKTTFDTKMWNQKPKWDIYVMGHIPEHKKYLEIRGWLTKGKMEKLMEIVEQSGSSAEGCAKVIRNFGNGPRTDWTFNDEAMFDTDELFSSIFI